MSVSEEGGCIYVYERGKGGMRSKYSSIREPREIEIDTAKIDSPITHKYKYKHNPIPCNPHPKQTTPTLHPTPRLTYSVILRRSTPYPSVYPLYPFAHPNGSAQSKPMYLAPLVNSYCRIPSQHPTSGFCFRQGVRGELGCEVSA